MHHLIEYLLHIDQSLIAIVQSFGNWTYLLLFLIIFAETGLVVAPFLPGDSLIFTAGSLAAHRSHVLDFGLLLLILSIASILGNKINYAIGRWIGPRVFQWQQSRFLNQEKLRYAHLYYEKHGGKTLIIGRFMPILRTFAPFVAGIGNMEWVPFTCYNLFSGILWIGSLLACGYYFGHIPFVQKHFALILYGIVFASLTPLMFTLLWQLGKVKKS